MKGHTCLQVQGDHLPFLLTDSCSVTVFVFKTLLTIVHGYKPVVKSQTMNIELLGGSGGFVNSLDFCLASLKSFGCFYFWCVLSSQWKVVTVNLRILHCQL